MRLAQRYLPMMFAVGFASVVSAQTVKDDQIAQDARRALHEDEFDALLVGEREVPIVTMESTVPIRRGVAVIIGEAGEGPMSHHTLAPLASELNQYGWVTMTMSAPSQGFFDFSVDEEAASMTDEADMQAEDTAEEMADTPAETLEDDSENMAESDDNGGDTAGQAPARPIPPPPPPAHPAKGLEAISKDDFAEHEQQLEAQMRAVVTRTSQYPGFFLVIAQGTTGAWLTKLYAEQRLDLPDAMVVVNPYWPQREYNQTLPQHIAATTMPLMDVYSPWDNGWGKQTVTPRRIAAENGLKMHYRQRELIGQAMDPEQFRLLGKEIYGWLTYLGW